jgi:hypothetical protein
MFYNIGHRPQTNLSVGMNIESEEEGEVGDGGSEDDEATDDALKAVAEVVLGHEVVRADFPDLDSTL